jgi:hypothetical protein
VIRKAPGRLPDTIRRCPFVGRLRRSSAPVLTWPSQSALPRLQDDLRPKEVTASQPTVATRILAHPVARALIRLADCPLAAPSVNTSGRPSPTHFGHVVADMTARASSDPSSPGLCVLSGSISDVGLESTVVDGVSFPDRLRILTLGGIGTMLSRRAFARLDCHIWYRCTGGTGRTPRKRRLPLRRV